MRALRSFAALAAVTMLGSCAVLPQSPPPIPELVPVIEPSLRPGDAYVSDDGFTRAQRVSLRVRTESCEGFGNGSAWVLSENLAISNKHVVEDATEVEVTSYDGRNYKVTDIVVSTVSDLALLTIAGEFPELAVIATEEPEPGSTMHIVGYPEGSRLTVSSGRYGSTVEDTLDLNHMRVYSVAAESKQGNSGSPVVNDNDEVVGVLFASNDFGNSYVVTLNALNEFLDDESTHRTVANRCPWD